MTIACATLACRGLIGMAFAVSAFTKLRSVRSFRDFASWLGALPLLAAAGRPAVAKVIAVAEAVVVVLLALPWTWRGGLLLATAVLAVFAAGAAAVARAGVRAPCHCFGASAVPLGTRHVLRNIVLCAAAAAGAAGIGPEYMRPASVALGLGAAAIAAMFVVFLDDLAAVLAAPVPVAGDGGPAGRRWPEGGQR